MLITHLYNFLTGLLYPPRCIFCSDIRPITFGKESWFCESCENNLDFIEPACQICGRQVEHGTDICFECFKQKPEFIKNVSLMEYHGTAQYVVYKLKYGNRPHIAKAFALLTYKHIVYPELQNVDFITPVPMYHKKQKKRGYNQAEIYAMELARLYGIPFYGNIIERAIDTPPQSGLSAEGRRKNIKGAFALNNNLPTPVAGKIILIADDIYTTGSTIRECCRVLLESGAGGVYSVTFAITMIGNDINYPGTVVL